MMLEVNQENSLNQVAVRLIEEPPLYSDIPIKTPEDAIRVMGGMDERSGSGSGLCGQ